MNVQVRLSKLCERMDDASNSTFKWKSLRTIKMEVLTQKVKKAWGKIHGKSFGRDEKPQVNKGRISLTLLSSLLCKKESLCTMAAFFPKKVFSLPHFPTQAFYSFSCFL